MKITVSGIVGSGKSSVSKAIAEKLDVERFHIGGIMREMAFDRGVSMPELTEFAKEDKSIDLELDERQRSFNDLASDFIMDSRLGFHFIPDSFKVFLKVDIDEAARRIFEVGRSEESYKDVDEAKVFLERRIESEKIRYKKLYDIDFPDGCGFDLVIDTTDIDVDEVVRRILSSIPEVDCD